MKKSTFFYLLILLLSFSSFLMAQRNVTTYSDSWGKQGFSLLSQEKTGVAVSYSVTEFALNGTTIDGQPMQNIELKGHFLQNNAGAPNIPGNGRYIAMPQGATPQLKIISSRTEIFQNVEIAPAPVPQKDNDRSPARFEKDAKIYSTNAFYPAQPIQISAPKKIRGVDVVMLGITPFQYNPITKELIVYRDIKVEVSFKGGNGHFGQDRLRSYWWDPILSDALMNYSSLPKMNYNKHSAKETGWEYLIIRPNGEEYAQWADSLKKFRTLQGITTGVVSLDEIGGTTATVIENYINNAYNTWEVPPAAVLILGDHGNDASKNVLAPITTEQGETFVCDNIYADVDGDELPEMVFARITANNAEQLETMVTKVLNYEKAPPTNPDFYQHPITALGWQTERWFQICSETVGGYFKYVLGKDPVRINAVYGGNPNTDPWSTNENTSMVINYFGPNGLGYIPATPSELGGWTGGNATMVNNAINSGAFILQHRDHGYEDGWGEPDYSTTNISGLTNTDLTFVMSINCLTGKYDYSSECFGEAFHHYKYNGQNSGALGFIAPSEVSYSFVNDTYVWGIYDNMWTDFMPDYGTAIESRGLLPAFGMAAGKFFLEESNWPSIPEYKTITQRLFHMHGDAFLRLYSEVPQSLTVLHNPILYAGVTSFDVTADEGAFIALTVNGEIIGTGVSQGGPVAINIPGQLPPNQMLVTVTKQNYYRYTALVDIVPPSGPYVVRDSYTLNDENGNNNGLADFGENPMISLSVKNVGVEQAENVNLTISTEDIYATITDATENYGNIPANEIVSVENGFAISISDTVPDQHNILFKVTATDGTNTWESYFSVKAYAPIITTGRVIVEEQAGNGNGRLDPGENANIIVKNNNKGHSDIYNLTASLFSSSPFITVNSAEYSIDTLAALGEIGAIFNVTVSSGAPLGTVAPFNYNIVSGNYNAHKDFALTIGLILEDWESGGMTGFNWATSGDAEWAVSDETPYEGTFCAKSGDISDYQSTIITLDYNVMADDSISFFCKVSSEEDYDYLKFYLDGAVINQWSGEVDWTRVVYPVTAGQHTFKWEYMKDVSQSNGTDAAYLDFIVLPPMLVTTAFAGLDASVCEGSTYQPQGSATNFTSVLWTTSGTGTFDDASLLNPVYTPSPEDIVAGSVVLTITAYEPVKADASDNMTLFINKSAVAFAGNNLAVCAGATVSLSEATAQNYSAINWTTTGTGTFDDATLINPVYTPSPEDIAAGTVTLTLTAVANAPCLDVSGELAITIYPLPTAELSGSGEICPGNTFDLTIQLTGAAPWQVLTLDSQSLTIETSPYTWTVQPNETTSYGLFSVSDANNCQNSATGLGEVTIKPLPEIPSMPVAVGNIDSLDLVYTTSLDFSITEVPNTLSYVWMLEPSNAGTIAEQDLTATVTWNQDFRGTALVSVKTVNDCGESAFSDAKEVKIYSTIGIDEPQAKFSLKVYPNPNNGNFKLDISPVKPEVVNIKLMNITGNMVYSENNVAIQSGYSQNLNLNHLNKGIYTLIIEGKGIYNVTKVVIK
ncbi:MAG: C25 family cysteine peptidase [Lentimicrobiaceae bacterium]|nr:C25 family cysteine peptidase [Lentimicrobiaceae bacterium]